MLTEQYETLRTYALAGEGTSGLRLGQGVLMARGMATWMQVAGELISSERSTPVFSVEAAPVPFPVQDELIRLMGEAVITLACGGSQ